MVTSGVRLGTPALTTRGMKEEDMRLVGTLICDVLDDISSEPTQAQTKSKVRELTRSFPLYPSRI
jgi:glycine hydroxymethyltransferase